MQWNSLYTGFHRESAFVREIPNPTTSQGPTPWLVLILWVDKLTWQAVTCQSRGRDGAFPLSQPVPPNLKTPLSLSHLSHEDLKTPLSLSHLSHVLQPVPTCPIWLSHSSFPNSLFLDHFLGFSLSFHFSKVRKTLLTEIFSSKYYHVGESKQLTNFQEKIGDNRDNTLEHMSMFCLEFNSSTLWHINTLNKLCLKVHTLYVSLTHCHILHRGSHHRPVRDTSLARRNHEPVALRSLLWLTWT